MKKSILTLLILLVTLQFSVAQIPIGKHRFLFGTIGNKFIRTHGIAVGSGWKPNTSDRSHSTTNGLRLEIIGLGLLTPLIPKSPIIESDSLFQAHMETKPGQKINGLNISASGSVCDCVTNGISAGFIGQINRKVNGIAIVGQINIVQEVNGVQIGLFTATHQSRGLQAGFTNGAFKMNGIQAGAFNYSKKLKGVQIGLINSSENLRGFQFGLWNNNGKRKLPFINWRFRE